MKPCLTGRCEWRSGIFGKLALFVEEAFDDYDWRTCFSETRTRWRRASVVDLGLIDVTIDRARSIKEAYP
jgi:hypothetical protein